VYYRLLHSDTGELASELHGARTTLTLSGSAVFGESASDGVLISGGGTQRALVEFVEGIVTLAVHDATAEEVLLGVRTRRGRASSYRATFGGLRR